MKCDRYIVKTSVFLILVVNSFSLFSKTLTVFHDADYSVNSVSANAMKMGFLTALDEMGNDFNGYKIEFVEKNHKGNIKRSFVNMRQFVNSSDAIFVLGGLHSPPYIKNRTYINENKVLLLVPWAAGGPITRYDQGSNWVYRLSIDDTKAGYRLGKFAEKELQCKRPHMLLENTPWGNSNYKTINRYFEGKQELKVTWFDWNTKGSVAKIKLREAIENDADCILFVANYAESKAFFNAMVTFPAEQQLPFVSHWGFTGGDIDSLNTGKVSEKLGLHFLQSCFSFIDNDKAFDRAVLARAQRLFPKVDFSAHNLKAPAGFIHSYDLGKVVLAALKNIKLTDDIKVNRLLLKNELESASLTAKGLIKEYKGPFSKWSKDTPDAHEALGLEDFCMAHFGPDNEVIIHQ